MNVYNMGQLTEKGFINVGEVDGFQVMAKRTDVEGEFVYHLLINDQTIWAFPKNSSLSEILILMSIKEALYR